MAFSDLNGMTPTQRPQQNWASRMFMGTPQWNEQVQQYSPMQNQAMDQALQTGLGGIGQFDFAPIEQQARTQFQQKTLPSIAERFAGMGGLGSGAFAQTMGQAGAGLEESLASMKQNYNLQREPLMQNLMSMGMQPRFQSLIHPRQEGMLESGLSSILAPLMGGFGSAFGGVAGQKFGNWAMPSNIGQTGSSNYNQQYAEKGTPGFDWMSLISTAAKIAPLFL